MYNTTEREKSADAVVGQVCFYSTQDNVVLYPLWSVDTLCPVEVTRRPAPCMGGQKPLASRQVSSLEDMARPCGYDVASRVSRLDFRISGSGPRQKNHSAWHDSLPRTPMRFGPSRAIPGQRKCIYDRFILTRWTLIPHIFPSLYRGTAVPIHVRVDQK